MEDLSGFCASQARFSEAAAHMLQLAQDAFAAVILHPGSGCLLEMSQENYHHLSLCCHRHPAQHILSPQLEAIAPGNCWMWLLCL